MVSSPGTALRLKVSLAKFCDRYEISELNCERLKDLEYVPGNKLVEKLGEAEWRGIAKFSVLGWQGFLAAHRQFLLDVKEGRWDNST